MVKINMVEAVSQALMHEMEHDDRVIVTGEDVGQEGGVFRATEGLQKKFGKERVVDTPLSEAGIVGTAIGMAIYGLRPVVEIQFSGFTFPAFDQIISHAARIRNRSLGRFFCPIVVRTPCGAGVRGLEHHSEAIEALYAHIPGLKVVMPSNPYDTKGLLISAIRDDGPVIFLEHKALYRAFKQEVPDEHYEIPLGSAKVVKVGKDITVVTYGAMVRVCQEAADVLEQKQKADLEVIDLRTVSPIDTETIIESVKKTGRCIVVHEAPRTLGIGAEVVARINEKALLYMKAPIKRVTGFDIIPPLPKMEDYNRPNVDRILDAVDFVMGY